MCCLHLYRTQQDKPTVTNVTTASSDPDCLFAEYPADNNLTLGPYTEAIIPQAQRDLTWDPVVRPDSPAVVVLLTACSH